MIKVQYVRDVVVEVIDKVEFQIEVDVYEVIFKLVEIKSQIIY